MKGGEGEKIRKYKEEKIRKRGGGRQGVQEAYVLHSSND